ARGAGRDRRRGPAMTARPDALLVLADGTTFEGEAVGAEPAGGVATGEVVFNTVLSGYQEVITDPSYAGQIITFTYPHIGNYGVTPDDHESVRPYCRALVVPASTPADAVLAREPDGVFLSNGPGDPAAVTYASDAIGGLVGRVPVFGICLGHQLLATALGGRTYKLKFGHHGGNHPVRRLTTGAVEITSQNHNYAVAEGSVPRADVTHVNLNDGVVEGIRCRDVPAFGVQYHPEAGPGPHDARYLFEHFRELMEAHA